MKVLVDSNVLLRLAQAASPHHKLAVESLLTLAARREILCLVPQVLYEYWVVATRPMEANGLGLAPTLAERSIQNLLAAFSLLRDERGIFNTWLSLVTMQAVSGKAAHDARLVAAMERHGLTTLLTFNGSDFTRYSKISVLAPHDVVNGGRAT